MEQAAEKSKSDAAFMENFFNEKDRVVRELKFQSNQQIKALQDSLEASRISLQVVQLIKKHVFKLQKITQDAEELSNEQLATLNQALGLLQLAVG